MSNVKPIPPGHTTVTASITYDDCARAIDFYTKAFGATERGTRALGPDGKIMHAEIQIGSAVVMVHDEIMGTRSARSQGGSPVSFYLYFEDADAAHAKAMAAGAKQLMPPTDMFWGDRLSHVEDPFGYHWDIATHVKDVTPEQMKKGLEEFVKQTAGAR